MLGWTVFKEQLAECVQDIAGVQSAFDTDRQALSCPWFNSSSEPILTQTMGQFFWARTGEFTTFLNLPRSHTIFANGLTRIRHIKRIRFLSLIEAEPSISQAMLTLTLERNYELLSNLDSNRRLSLPARVARLLFAEFDKSEKSGTIVCRQEDLAFMIGVSRMAVGKALDKLANKSLIETGYGKIHVPDTEALKRYVDTQDPLSSIRHRTRWSPDP